MSNVYPKETVEFQPVLVTVDGTAVTDDVELAVVVFQERPETWSAPVELDGKIGVMIDSYEPGRYDVWARVTDAPEIVVVKCGGFMVV